MNRTLSVWRWQLIFTGSMVAIVVVLVAFKPGTLATPLVAAGLTLLTAVTIATLAVPWRRLPRAAIVAVPLLDATTVGLLTSIPDVRLALLWVFPVTWLATYFSLVWVFAGIGYVTVLLIVFGGHGGDAADVMVRVLSVVLTLSFLGAIIHIGASRSRASRRLLQRQSEQVSCAARRAETQRERVTQIIDVLDTALVVVDAQGSILRMNDSYRALYGRDRFGALLPLAAVEYDDRRGVPVPPELTVLSRAARGEELRGERVWLFDGDGRWRALQVSARELAGAEDDGRVVLVAIEDVTDALEAAEERRTLTAIVSHELRNPLTAILGHADLLLERDDLPASVVTQLGVVANAGERMQQLMSGLLAESRAETARLAEPVDLRRIAEESAASYAPIVRAGRQHLSVEGQETLMIDGDAFRLRQVLDNLLSNAVKYTPAGGLITVRLGLSDRGEAELGVADTGVGMTDAEVERLFEPFFRSESARHSGAPGTGLGMGIARDIVVDHGGTIDVASEVGVGTTVTLRLPRRADAGGVRE